MVQLLLEYVDLGLQEVVVLLLLFLASLQILSLELHFLNLMDQVAIVRLQLLLLITKLYILTLELCLNR